MKLDKRIKEDYKIFTCFGTEQAEQYVDSKGYFTNDIDEYRRLDDCYYGTLNVVDNNSSIPYLNKDFSRYFSFFLPEEFVKQKEVEKKYRPYKLNEFLKEIPMHTVITMRKKGDNDCIITCTFTGYRTRIICTDVCLGVEWVSLGTLADEYEYKNTYIGDWKPFGVEE